MIVMAGMIDRVKAMKEGVKEKVFLPTWFSYFSICVKAMKEGVKEAVLLFSPCFYSRSLLPL